MTDKIPLLFEKNPFLPIPKYTYIYMTNHKKKTDDESDTILNDETTNALLN